MSISQNTIASYYDFCNPFFINKTKQGQAMIEQRSQPHCFLTGIAQHFHVGPMPVPVQNQVIHHQHLIDRVFPAHTDAKIHRRFIRQALHLVVSVQRKLAFPALLEIL